MTRSIKCKFLLLTAFLVSGMLVASAQMGKAYEMNVEGVKVIVQPSGNEIVEIQTIFKGGVQNYSVAQQGIESLAMTALVECGNAKDDKNHFKDKLDAVSAQINVSSGTDYSTVALNCTLSDFEKIWPLYVSAITSPSFDTTEFERIRQDAINNLKAQASQPDYAIDILSKQTAYAGRDYAKRPEGTEQTIAGISAAATRDYYRSLLTRSRLVIVVVSSLEEETIRRSLTQLLSGIPAGAPVILKRGSAHPDKNGFVSEKRDFATNYIQAISDGPEPGTPDYNAFVLAMRIFSQRHFLEVRTNNGLSYAPGAWFDGGLTASANFSVSTTEPDKYIKVFKSLVDKTRKQGFTADELRDIKTGYLTSFFYRQETNGAQASSLAANEVLHQNWKRAVTISEDIKKVSLPELNRVFNKYVTNFSWAYQGDPAKVNPQLFTEARLNRPVIKPKSKVVNRKKG